MNFNSYPLQTLHLFPVYQTREAYKTATGEDAPPFNPAKPVKSWHDPKAIANPRRTLVYDNVLAYSDNGAPMVDGDGKPFLEPLLISREDASTVNIPVKDFTGQIQEQQTVGIEVPVPMRALTPNEELFFKFGNTVAVRNKTSVVESAEFTAQDRAVLHAIAAKLGVA